LSDQQTPVRGVRAVLPEGTLPVGIGLIVSGISAYGFLSLSQAGLGEIDSKHVAQLWFATFILAPGFFLPVEQEVGRALAHRRALVQGARPVLAKALVLAGGLLASVILFLIASSALITSELFGGNWFLFGSLLLAFAGYSTAHFARGVFAGSGRFQAYGEFMAGDGLIRVLSSAVLVALGVEAAGAYGLLVGLPPFIALAVAFRGRSGVAEPGPAASWSEITQNLGWLVIGSLFAAALVNAGPLAANLLADPSQDDLVRDFSFAVLIARIPLFMFQAVQAALLPKLARLAAQGAYADFQRGLRKLMVVVLGIGAIGVLGAFVVGPKALELMFQAEASRRTLTLLALGSAVYMVALAVAQAVIALHGHARVALGWTSAMAMFVLVTLFSSRDLLLRVELGLVAGSLTAAAVFALALRQRLRSGARPDEASIYEALVDFPVEP
jgi:O-antigen/teichoic acid export membrane protein